MSERIVNQLAWRIGGEQGEGIDSTGEIFAKAMTRLGLHIYTYRSFGSRIRGGLTFYEIRVTEKEARARADETNYVVALGQEVIDATLDQLADDAVVLYDSDAFQAKVDAPDKHVQLVGVPLTKLAEQHGNRIMKNMVSLGATARLLEIPLETFYEFVEERFGRKGAKIVDMNKAVIKAGYEYVAANAPKASRHVIERRPFKAGRRPFVLTGNTATSYGALVAGCRFVAGYPITPATDVLEWFIDHVDEYGGVVVQTEDELSAINMVLGAGYGGVRAATSTSGPGLSLMTEAVGLAGMAEIPCVVIDVMRPGPSTGLPTKHSQADLLFVLHAGHDDFSRIIVSPSTVEDAFYLIQEAFNWSEEYQLPVFFLIDQDLAIALDAVEKLDPKKIPMRRGKLMTESQAAALAPGEFKRFAKEADGISPRSIPSFPNTFYMSSGSEHNELSVITENRRNRNEMMEKRARKLETFTKTALPGDLNGGEAWGDRYGDEHAKIGTITWGSTRHAVDEACGRIEKEGGAKFKHLVLRTLWPFPHKQVTEFMKSCDKVVVAEINFGGHLAKLIQQEIGGHDKIMSLTKYDGTPFRPMEIVDKLNEVI